MRGHFETGSQVKIGDSLYIGFFTPKPSNYEFNFMNLNKIL